MENGKEKRRKVIRRSRSGKGRKRRGEKIKNRENGGERDRSRRSKD